MSRLSMKVTLIRRVVAVHGLADILDSTNSDLEIIAIDIRARRLLVKWWLTGQPL